MAEKSYVKISRCLLENVVFHNEKLLKVWMWCLLKASYKDRDIQVGMQTVHILPGQFIFGRRAAAAELRFSESFVFRSMKQLELLQKLNIKANNKFSLVTIENWVLYQGFNGSDEQQNEQQMNNKRTTDEQQMNTNNKVKKVKKGNNTPLTPQGGGGDFEIFWAAYPKKTSKPAATKAWAKLKPGEETVKAMLAAIEAAKRSTDWQKDGGKYVPYPATWLNNRRWEDARETKTDFWSVLDDENEIGRAISP